MIAAQAQKVVQKVLKSSPPKAPVAQGDAVLACSVLNKEFAALRDAEMSGPFPEEKIIRSGMKLHQDLKAPRVLDTSGPAGTLLRYKASAVPASGWAAVHFELGPLDFSQIDTFGVLIKTQSHQRATTTRVCLRSGTGNKFRDFFLEKHLVSTTAPGRHIDLHPVGSSEMVPLTANWRELVLFFAPQEIDLSVTDLRLFAV